MNRRIIASLFLMVLAVCVAMSGVLLYPSSHELVVPIDRSALDAAQEKQTDQSGKIQSPEPKKEISRALPLAPDQRLIETTSYGFLPRKAENGDRPSEIYARPLEHARVVSPRPKLAIGILNAGVSEILTAEAYLALPSDVSFVMSPYAHDAERQMRDIRNRGHEVFLSIQTKVEALGREDRGPYALDPSKDGAINRDRLYWMMSRMTGYAGLIADLTPAAAHNQILFDLIRQEAAMRGLSHLSWFRENSFEKISDLSLSRNASAPRVAHLSGEMPDTLKEELRLLLNRIKTEKQIMAFIAPSPLALEALKEWLEIYANDEFDLVPLSVLMRAVEQI